VEGRAKRGVRGVVWVRRLHSTSNKLGNYSGVNCRRDAAPQEIGPNVNRFAGTRGQGTNSGHATESGNQFPIQHQPARPDDSLTPQPPPAARFRFFCRAVGVQMRFKLPSETINKREG
jgi:hypothetical protein